MSKRTEEQPADAPEEQPAETEAAIAAPVDTPAIEESPSAPKGEPEVHDLTSDPSSETPEEETPAEPGEGEERIVYRGLVNLFEYGEYRFRPGQPVIVPSDVAEDLLSYPNEKFEAVKE